MGIGKNPPVFLQPGDEVSASISGLGALTNKIGTVGSTNSTQEAVEKQSSFALINASKTLGGGIGLTQLNGKPLHYKKVGSGGENVVFIHGLGGSMEYWTPLIPSLEQTHTLHLFDFEGHGLSPTHPLSRVDTETIAADLHAVVQHAGAPATVVAHSLGCLAALQFSVDNPELVRKLVLVGPPPSPLSQADSDTRHARAALVRARGIAAVVDAIVNDTTSARSKEANPVAATAARLSLLGQDPESYAKACDALGRAKGKLEVEKLSMPTLIITGDEDKISPPALCEEYISRIPSAQLVVLKGIGHWPVYEGVAGVIQALKSFL